MADVQPENGVTRIANSILEALAKSAPGGSEMQILLFILRKTYGWHKKEDQISISQIVENTGLSRRMVIYSLQNLEAKRMIIITRKRGRGNINEINKIAFQKNYDVWVVQGKSSQYRKSLEKQKEYYKKQKERGSAMTRGVVQGIKNNGRFIAPTKETIQKKVFVATFPEDSDPYKLGIHLTDQILKNNPKFKKPNFQSWSKEFDRIIRIDKRTPDEIAAVIEWAQNDKFWKANILSPIKLREKYDTLWMQMNR